MSTGLTPFYAFLSRPLFLRGRVLLALLVVPLALSFSAPLWRIAMYAPQYPGGLTMDIYAYQLVSGHDGQDLHEINTLNHYIGMQHIDREALADLDWIPFALGALVILSLRVAAVGDVRALVDLAVITLYVSAFSFARFAYRLYSFGHHLSPQAPVKVKPFMPVLLGTKQVANFDTHSYPQLGSLFMGLFVLGVLGLTAWHLWAGRRAAMESALVDAPAKAAC
jgi:hypothetical protein